MRVGIIGLLQESNTFVDQKTTVQHFEQDLLLVGEEIRERLASAHHEVGGFFAGLAENHIEAVPIFIARAIPYGTMSRETLDCLVDTMLQQLDQSGPLDGILVAPHGATVSDEHRDVDGYWLTELRRRLGKTVPLVGTLDLHANLSQRMVDATDALIAYRTNPHTDQRDCGANAARLIARTIGGEVRPVQSAVLLPLGIDIECQLTSEPPCLDWYTLAEEVQRGPAILCASLLLGFPYADVEEMGAAVLVTADGDAARAAQAAQQLARYAWDRRQQFVGAHIGIEEAIRQAVQLGGTVGLLDMGDNVGGGAPGDGTHLGHALRKAGCSAALITLWDPQAAAEARAAGPGRRLTLRIGGKSGPLVGPPLEGSFEVLSLHDGSFEEPDPRHGGFTAMDQGPTAVVRSEDGLTVLVTTRRTPPFSLRQLTSCSLQPASFQQIVCKGVHAPLAAYRSVCQTFVRVDTPGVTTADMTQLDYHNRRRPMFPFERETTWEPPCEPIALKEWHFDSGVPGPHLLITGGVHGDELEPIVAVQRMIERFDSVVVRGRVTLIPIVNEAAFARGLRTAEDGLDLARTFPGHPDGTVTERVAFALAERIRAADYYIDLHSGGRARQVLAMCGYMMHPDPSVLDAQRKLARAFNLPVIWGTDYRLDGRSLSVARDAHVPAIYTEYHGGGTCDPAGVEAYLGGCLNVLASLQMADRPVPEPAIQHQLEDSRPDSGHMQICHPAPMSGLFQPSVQLGDHVPADAPLGTVSDALGTTVETVRATHAGIVLVLRTIAHVVEGDGIAVILPASDECIAKR